MRVRRALSSTLRTTPALSMAGEVFGIMTKPVTPPLIAASAQVAMFSLSSWPGSRAWTWMSNRPGSRMRPVQSMTSAFSTPVMFAATPMILSPSTSTSAVWSFGESSLAIWAWR
jgi:hypothetical protein